MNFRKVFLRIISLLVAIFLASCANVVPPSGGPKDKAPPQMTKSSPPNYSLNFNTETVRIYFNEFVWIKNPSSAVIISPPVDKMPEFKEKGKSVIIELNDSLKENTTYTIFFGDAIVDITEENPASNFQYVFSTGDQLDSLRISGFVHNAFSLEPEEGVFVMLYREYGDSVPMLQSPYYLSKTNAEGFFELNNLRDGQYKIFALKDVNANYIYDQPNEEIAFLDSLLTPVSAIKSVTDSMPDSLNVDSVLSVPGPPETDIHLSIFPEVDSAQKLKQANLLKTGQLMMLFRYPVKDLGFEFLKPRRPDDWYMIEEYAARDTLLFWVKDRSVDTLMAVVRQDTSILDTLETELIYRTRSKKDQDLKDRLNVNSDASGKFDLHKKLIIHASNPIKETEFSRIRMIEGADTLSDIPFTNSSLVPRKIELNWKWKEKTSYVVILPDSTLFDIYNQTHDSLIMQFKTREESDYGVLRLNIHLMDEEKQYIIQLLNAQGEVAREKVIHESGQVSFSYLLPGKFSLKAIQDRNYNGVWDTGVYLESQQPESVYLLPEEFDVRANWEIDAVWELK